MPALGTALKKNTQLRMMLYGAQKTKKTWWAGKAAEAGFNVLFFEGDGNFGILQNIAPEAQERIFVLPARDRLNKAVFAEIMAVFLETETLIWDEKEQVSRFSVTEATRDQCIYIDKKQLDTNWIVVLDSWTALAWSIAFQYSLENKISLSDAKKEEWPGYGFAGRLATWMVSQLKNIFNCHIIVIGHTDVYESYKMQGDKRVLNWTRAVPKSTSGPHALTLAKNFTDILTFSVVGSTFKIDSRADKDRDGGSINIPPNLYKWEDLQFKDVIKMADLDFPPDDLPVPDFSISDELFEKLKPKKPGGKLATKKIEPKKTPAQIGVKIPLPTIQKSKV